MNDMGGNFMVQIPKYIYIYTHTQIIVRIEVLHSNHVFVRIGRMRNKSIYIENNIKILSEQKDNSTLN